MPLHVPEAPAAVLRSVLAALRSPSAAQGAHAPSFARAAHGTLRAELPLPLYELDTTGDGTAGTGTPAHTRLTGWRFLLRATDAPADAPSVGSAEAMLTADGWAFAGFREGPYVTSTERALHQAESLSAAHQPRLLSVPRLYTLTLWLHSDVTADAAEGAPQPADVLIPLAPAPPGIAAHRPHRMDALLPVLTSRLVHAPMLTTPV